MRLYEFVPIDDPLIEGESLIETVFGLEFCVVDETGHLLTTVQNQNLLRRARSLADQREALGWEACLEALWALRARAETLTQRDYDLAISREAACREDDVDYEFSLKAGSLT